MTSRTHWKCYHLNPQKPVKIKKNINIDTPQASSTHTSRAWQCTTVLWPVNLTAVNVEWLQGNRLFGLTGAHCIHSYQHVQSTRSTYIHTTNIQIIHSTAYIRIYIQHTYSLAYMYTLECRSEFMALQKIVSHSWRLVTQASVSVAY